MIWVPFTLRRFASFLGKLLLAVAMALLVAVMVCSSGCDDKQSNDDELERLLVHRAMACRASCETAGLCVSAFDPIEENWGHMDKCECGPCAGLIGGP